MLIFALLAFFSCGIVGVLVDIDHPIAFRLGKRGHALRIFHLPIFVLSILALLGLGAYITRLVVG